MSGVRRWQLLPVVVLVIALCAAAFGTGAKPIAQAATFTRKARNSGTTIAPRTPARTHGCGKFSLPAGGTVRQHVDVDYTPGIACPTAYKIVLAFMESDGIVTVLNSNHAIYVAVEGWRCYALPSSTNTSGLLCSRGGRLIDATTTIAGLGTPTCGVIVVIKGPQNQYRDHRIDEGVDICLMLGASVNFRIDWYVENFGGHCDPGTLIRDKYVGLPVCAIVTAVTPASGVGPSLQQVSDALSTEDRLATGAVTDSVG